MPPLSESGILTCEITPRQSISDIDCRPLVGLVVHICDHTDDRPRHRALAALVAKAAPALLVMPILHADGSLTLHRRWGGANPHTETTRA